MKKSIKTEHQLNAPIDSLWELVKSGAEWEKWLPILTDSSVEGNTRVCNLENGDVLEEKFLASEAEKTFMYAITKQASFPAQNIVAIMRLSSEDENTTRLNWSVDMEPESEEAFQMLESHISDIYTKSAIQLQELAKQTA